MLKTALERFMLKRVTLVFIGLSILDLIFMQSKWFILIGLMAGSIVGMFRFGVTAFVVSKLLSLAGNKVKNMNNIYIYALNQILVVVVSAVMLKYSLPLFLGFLVGILIVPATICFNGITEMSGISNNNFE